MRLTWKEVMREAKDFVINKIATKHGMNEQNDKDMVWAAETTKKGEVEKRNTNALG